MSIYELEKKHAPFDTQGVHWVCLAIKRPGMSKDYRFHTNHVKVEKGVVMATNGERMHRYWLKSRRIPDGYYKITMSSRTKVVLRHVPHNGTYPPTDEMFKISEGPCMTKVVGFKLKRDRTSVSKMYTEIVREMTDNMTLNYKYLDDALCEDDFFDAHFSYNDTTKPVLLVNSMGTKMAIIMTVKL